MILSLNACLSQYVAPKTISDSWLNDWMILVHKVILKQNLGFRFLERIKSRALCWQSDVCCRFIFYSKWLRFTSSCPQPRSVHPSTVTTSEKWRWPMWSLICFSFLMHKSPAILRQHLFFFQSNPTYSCPWIHSRRILTLKRKWRSCSPEDLFSTGLTVWVKFIGRLSGWKCKLCQSCKLLVGMFRGLHVWHASGILHHKQVLWLWPAVSPVYSLTDRYTAAWRAFCQNLTFAFVKTID